VGFLVLVECFYFGFVVDSLQPLQFLSSVEFGYHRFRHSTLKHIHIAVTNPYYFETGKKKRLVEDFLS